MSECFKLYFSAKSWFFKYKLSGQLNEEERDGRGMWNVWGRGEVHTGFWWRDLRERDVLERIGINERIILKGCTINRMRG